MVHNNGQVHTIRGRRHVRDTSVRGKEKRRPRAATPQSSHCSRMGERECRGECTLEGAKGSRTAFDAPVNLPRSTRPYAADARYPTWTLILIECEPAFFQIPY